MDKSWTDAKRGFEEYFHGLDSFVEFVAHTACQGKNYRAWVFNGEFESTPTTTEGGSSCVHESLDQCGDFHGMLHDLHPMTYTLVCNKVQMVLLCNNQLKVPMMMQKSFTT